MSVSLTIPSRSYPIGVTSGQRSLPGTQHYATVTLSADLTGWISPSTTRVRISVEWSSDGGVTFQPFVSVIAVTPPPYPHKNGPSTNVLTATATRDPFDPTHVRGSITVDGQTVTIGQIVLTAN